MLALNNIEVMYDKIILVLKGLSLKVPQGQIVALLGSNGAGKTTTLKAISGLLAGEDGEVTDGNIQFHDKDIHGMEPDKIVREGIFQVMEGRRVFEHLTVEENLIAGAFTRKDKGGAKNDLQLVYEYFPKLKQLKSRVAGYLSGENSKCWPLAAH